MHLTAILGLILALPSTLAAEHGTSAASTTAALQSVEATFDQANRLYEEKRFAEAAQLYEKILQQGTRSPTLYFNLGNARYKAGQLGKAIVAYRRGLQLAPRDPDLRFNLGFVRNQVTGSSRGPHPLWQRWLTRLSLDEWTWLLALVYWPWMALLAVGEWRPPWKPALRLYVLLGGGLTVLCGICLALAWHQHHRHDEAVVVVPNAVVRYGPLEESQVAFQLRDGTELRVIGRKQVTLPEGSQLWLHIQDTRERTGWVKADQVELIKPVPAPG